MRFARTAATLGVLGAVATATLAGLGGTPAQAAQGASISVSPSSGAPGSGFTITFSNFPSGCAIQFRWDNQALASAPWQSRGSVQVAVPGAARTGPHIVTGQGCQEVARDIFLVVPGSGPTATPAPNPPPPSTTGQRPTTSRQPTTTKRTTTTAPPTSTGASTTSTTTSTGPGRLTFDKDEIKAGEPLSASGTGCPPNTAVTLTANGERVGATTTGADGSFSTPVEFTRIRPGRQLVTATCDDTVLAGSVELTLSTSASGSTGVLVVLVLVLLAGITLIAHHRTKARW